MVFICENRTRVASIWRDFSIVADSVECTDSIADHTLTPRLAYPQAAIEGALSARKSFLRGMVAVFRRCSRCASVPVAVRRAKSGYRNECANSMSPFAPAKGSTSSSQRRHTDPRSSNRLSACCKRLSTEGTERHGKGQNVRCRVRSGSTVDFACRADRERFDKIILEIKALSGLHDRHRAQLHNDLKATGVRVGLLVNLGTYASSNTTGSYADAELNQSFVAPKLQRSLSVPFRSFRGQNLPFCGRCETDGPSTTSTNVWWLSQVDATTPQSRGWPWSNSHRGESGSSGASAFLCRSFSWSRDALALAFISSAYRFAASMSASIRSRFS